MTRYCWNIYSYHNPIWQQKDGNSNCALAKTCIDLITSLSPIVGLLYRMWIIFSYWQGFCENLDDTNHLCMVFALSYMVNGSYYFPFMTTLNLVMSLELRAFYFLFFLLILCRVWKSFKVKVLYRMYINRKHTVYVQIM